MTDGSKKAIIGAFFADRGERPQGGPGGMISVEPDLDRPDGTPAAVGDAEPAGH